MTKSGVEELATDPEFLIKITGAAKAYYRDNKNMLAAASIFHHSDLVQEGWLKLSEPAVKDGHSKAAYIAIIRNHFNDVLKKGRTHKRQAQNPEYQAEKIVIMSPHGKLFTVFKDFFLYGSDENRNS